MDIPAGALTSSVTIQITRVAAPPAFVLAGGIGQAFNFAPNGSAFGREVSISIFVADAILAGVAVQDLSLITTALNSSVVETLSGISVQQVTGGVSVSGSTTHFSTFQAAVEEPPVPPPPTNNPPTASAGSDQQVDVGQAVNLAGSGNDPDGDPLTFVWRFLSRPAGSQAAVQNANVANASFTPDVAGPYSLELTASDGRGGVATDTVTITAVANNPPTANAGPDQQVNVGATVNLSGTGNDPDGDPLTFAWLFLARPAGSQATLSNADRQSASFVPDVVGPYTIELTTSDGRGGSATDQAVVTAQQAPASVVPIQLLASLQFSPSQVTISAGTTVRWVNIANISHTVTPDGHNEWTTVTLNQVGATFEHTFNTPGTFPYFCQIHGRTVMFGTITVQ